MVLPIFAYGHGVLREKCKDIDKEYPLLNELIDNMWETLQSANGCGLAAPQIGKPIRLFIVDSKTTFEYLDEEDREYYFEKGDTGIFETFINAQIVDRSDEEWEDEEGCLSIPGMDHLVERPWSITIEYQDKDFVRHRKTFGGATARMIQHEYDHTDGILYIDYLKPLTKKLLNGKLKKISKGDCKVKYPMKFLR